LAPITPNKNGWTFYKNLDAMIGATILQFLKYIVGVITSANTRPIPPLEMGRKAC
jgi:hypothetical protein